MSIKKNNPARQRSFMARHGAILKKVQRTKKFETCILVVKGEKVLKYDVQKISLIEYANEKVACLIIIVAIHNGYLCKWLLKGYNLETSLQLMKKTC